MNRMNKPLAIIFFGFLAVLMGIGNDKNEFFPSELKLLVGISLIIYGVYLIYKPQTKRTELKPQINNALKKGHSYIYLALGVLLIKIA